VEASYTFVGELRAPRHGDFWVMVALPADDAEDIKALVPHRPGFGSVRVSAAIGGSVWSTSIYPDNAVGSYLLPVKKSVRDHEGVEVGDVATITVTVMFD